jgi:hypothetical protein
MPKQTTQTIGQTGFDRGGGTMIAESEVENRSAFLHRGHSARDRSKTEEIPLSRRAQLASDAFRAGDLVKLMNRIIKEERVPENVDLSLVEDGIQLVKRLEKGDDYLDQRKFNLIPQPDSAETVKRMRSRGTSNIRGQIEEALSILRFIKETPSSGDTAIIANLDLGKVKSARTLFREIHASVIDQLGAFDLLIHYVHQE